jgi:nucleotide-binding universal stress UspA family protein
MFDHILVPLDGSSLAECVLPHAVALARAFEARVTLLRVLERTRADDRPESVDPLDWSLKRAEAAAYLSAWAGRLQEIRVASQHRLMDGAAADQVIDFVRDHRIDLIVLSSHGQGGLGGWNVSGTVQKIIHRAYVSVMIVRAYQPLDGSLTDLTYKRLLLAVDRSQRAECALPAAVQLSRFYRSRLLVASVISSPEMTRHRPLTVEEKALLDQITELNRAEAVAYLKRIVPRVSSDGVEVQTRLLGGVSAAEALQDLVAREEVDLVVLSAHGSSGGGKWPYGGVAINFVAYGTTPLLIVQDLAAASLEPTLAELAAREHKPR